VRITADPPSDVSAYEFAHQVRVRFAETDAMGIVHHSRYLPMMEEARVAYLRHIGHPYQSIRDEGIEMNVLEAFVRYRLPLVFDEVVDVNVSLASIERASFQMSYRRRGPCHRSDRPRLRESRRASPPAPGVVPGAAGRHLLTVSQIG
jgi:acyl-CoA thioester hydrolase